MQCNWLAEIPSNKFGRKVVQEIRQHILANTIAKRAPEQMKSFAVLHYWETEAPLQKPTKAF